MPVCSKLWGEPSWLSTPNRTEKVKDCLKTYQAQFKALWYVIRRLGILKPVHVWERLSQPVQRREQRRIFQYPFNSDRLICSRKATYSQTMHICICTMKNGTLYFAWSRLPGCPMWSITSTQGLGIDTSKMVYIQRPLSWLKPSGRCKVILTFGIMMVCSLLSVRTHAHWESIVETKWPEPLGLLQVS